MTAPALSIRALTKSFRPRIGLFRSGPAKLAVDAVDLEVQPAELFVLLGKNGAGKTTLIKMLATLILPSSGTAEVFGHDIVRDEQRVRRAIGLTSADERSFFWRLSGRQNLEFFASLHGLHGQRRRSRIAAIVERLGLDAYIDQRFDQYSSGMKQRVAIARGMLGDPRLLFLDEPTRSLDPGAQREMRGLVRDLAKGGLTVVLVTHQLEEARELGERFGFMDAGRLRVYARGELDPASLF